MLCSDFPRERARFFPAAGSAPVSGDGAGAGGLRRRQDATNIVVKDAAGKVIASATAKDGKYTVKLPADKAKDLTITQYVAK